MVVATTTHESPKLSCDVKLLAADKTVAAVVAGRRRRWWQWSGWGRWQKWGQGRGSGGFSAAFKQQPE